MNKLLAITVVEPVGGHGGMDYYDFSLCRELSANGCSVILLTCDKTNSNDPSFIIWTVYRHIFGTDSAWRRGLRFLWGSLNGLIRVRLRNIRISHFHFFHIGFLEFFNVLLSRILGIKVVVTTHDVESFKSGRSSNFLISRSYCA
jgi:D-inositol-3-phosphate glycosyltransferase